MTPLVDRRPDPYGELLRLAEGATPGPWKNNDTVIWRDGNPDLDAAIARNDPKARPIIASDLSDVGRGHFAATTYGPRPLRGANAAYIAAASPDVVAALIRENRQQAERIAALEKALGEILLPAAWQEHSSGGLITVLSPQHMARLRVLASGEAVGG